MCARLTIDDSTPASLALQSHRRLVDPRPSVPPILIHTPLLRNTHTHAHTQTHLSAFQSQHSSSPPVSLPPSPPPLLLLLSRQLSSLSAPSVMSCVAVPSLSVAAGKENCHPAVAAAAGLLKPAGAATAAASADATAASALSARPPLSRRTSVSILRASVGGQSSGHSAHSSHAGSRQRLSASTRRKSVSFATAMEEVRLFDSSHTAVSHSGPQRHSEHSTTADDSGANSVGETQQAQADAQQQCVESSPEPAPADETQRTAAEGAATSSSGAAVGALSEAEEAGSCGESMEFTALLAPPSLPAGAAVAAPGSPSVDMELTALLHTLPALVTAASRAARRSSLGSSTSQHSAIAAAPTRAAAEQAASTSAADPCDLLGWLSPHTQRQFALSHSPGGDSSMELTELVSACARGGAEDEWAPFPPPTAVAGEADVDDSADMEMTAILSKWSERSHSTALSPFAARPLPHSSAGDSPLVSAQAASRLSQRRLASPATRPPHHRLSQRLSASAALADFGSATAGDRQTLGEQQLLTSPLAHQPRSSVSLPASATALALSVPLPLPPPHSGLTRRFSTAAAASRVSVGFGAVGEQTAALSARWLAILDEQQTQRSHRQSQAQPRGGEPAEEEEDTLRRERRASSASTAGVGDCTADIARMLEAVLMDGQCTEAAMQQLDQHTHQRREQQRHDSTLAARTVFQDTDEGEADEQTEHTPRLSTQPFTPASPRASQPLAPPSPRSPAGQLAASDGDCSADAACEEAGSDSGSLSVARPVSFLDSAFHLLGVSSMDDSNLHAKLRKRDSSFQPAACDEASEAKDDSAPLQSAIARTLLSGEEVDELHSACLQLMDVNAQLRDDCAKRHSQLAQAHGAQSTAAAAQQHSSLHRFLSEVARSSGSGGSAAAPRPVASPALSRAVSSVYGVCVQQARLSWLQWQSALSAASASRSDGSGRQLEADGDMAAEVAAMQARLALVEQAALRDTRLDDSRRAALAAHRRCAEAARQLAALTGSTASQQRVEKSMAVALRQHAIALQDAAVRLEQQRVARQQVAQSRSLLSALARVGQCQLAAAAASHVDIALHTAPLVTLRCERSSPATTQQSAAHATEENSYTVQRLPGQPQPASSSLHAPLWRALHSALDGVLSLHGAHVSLSSLPALVRRCAAVVHRAAQWHRSVESVRRLHGARLVVSLGASPAACTDFVLSLRHQSGSRQHALLCRLTVTLGVEARSAASVLRHDVRSVSMRPSAEMDAAKRSLSEWLAHDRTDGYAQLERVSSRIEELIAKM